MLTEKDIRFRIFLKMGVKLKKSTITFLSLLVVAGCATITRGTTQTVAINTPGVTGATCVLTSSAVGSMTVTTPAAVTLSKGSDSVIVRCTKDCYNEGSGVLSSNLEGMTAGNLIVGGVIGLGVDAASGAMNKYAPQVDITMVPNNSCRRRG